MEITDDLMDYLEELSRLQLAGEEKTRIKRDLGLILEYVAKLNEMDTRDVEPVSHVISMENVFRKDLVTCADRSEEILSNAPDKKDGAFVVPKLIE